ncbi:MAG: hypothetical protein KGL39_31715 [Patescibacteria group bacterium]|nr:hypothetical protein [Patescibacteria group bacterium]
MPLYICYFEEVRTGQRLPAVDIEDLLHELWHDYGPTRAVFQGRFVKFELQFPAILTRSQRLNLRRHTLAVLHERFPDREFRAGLFDRRPMQHV